MLVPTVMPLTDVRAGIGKITDNLKDLQTVFLTKRGRPKAVLVDFAYWKKILEQLAVLTEKTFIKKDLLPFTRQFSDREIDEWLKEDQL